VIRAIAGAAWFAACSTAFVSWPGAAAAQTGTVHRAIEIDVAALVIGAGSFGSAGAELATGSGGTPLTLFTTSYSSGASIGPEVRFGLAITPHLRAEASGSWTRVEYRAQLSGDFEGADAVTAAQTVSVYTVEGSGLWYFATRGALQPFVRGGAGWLRGLSDDGVLSADSLVASGGGGVKYWWHQRDRGAVKRMGVRAESAVISRSAALPFGGGRRQLVVSVSAGLAIGF
jgi:hypothetical protein